MANSRPKTDDAKLGGSPVDVCSLIASYAALHRLSEREAEVLVGYAQGESRKATAFRLNCSSSTVDTYWKRLLRKTNLRSREQILASLLDLVFRDQARSTDPVGAPSAASNRWKPSG